MTTTQVLTFVGLVISAIRWPWGLSQIRSLAKGEKSKRSGSRPQWRRWLSSMSFPSVSTAPARDRDGRAVVASRSKFARGTELGTRVGAQFAWRAN